MLIGATLSAAPAIISAQVSLATVVDLAQHKSNTVKLAETDKRKAEATLAETKDVFLPNLTFGSGLPAFPEVGFSEQCNHLHSTFLNTNLFRQRASELRQQL